ncbi:MAG: hypothetical protein KF859_03290 [Phycisphaeraceae bacterium]|nr:hypothetical protein [Phycisphaeraceae bacterium]
MPLSHFTDRHLVQLLATESRRTDTSPSDLAASHVALGRFLAGELLEAIPLETRDIQHPQGVRQGWRIQAEQEIALVVLMRAGLYVGEGFREVFRSAPVLHVSVSRGEGLPPPDLEQMARLGIRRCVLIDSVVNTGGSVEPALRQLSERSVDTFVAALVTPRPTAVRLAETWPRTQFLFARLSDNQYVGVGPTDTGNRLFGTIHRGKGEVS